MCVKFIYFNELSVLCSLSNPNSEILVYVHIRMYIRVCTYPQNPISIACIYVCMHVRMLGVTGDMVAKIETESMLQCCCYGHILIGTTMYIVTMIGSQLAPQCTYVVATIGSQLAPQCT